MSRRKGCTRPELRFGGLGAESKRAAGGFTLVELLVVLAVIGLLVGMLLPALGAAVDRAKLTACASGLRAAQQALLGYAVANNRRLPPFAFSDYGGDLPLSGHWGGTGEAGDPGGFGRAGVSAVNLWVLSDARRIAPARLVCPAAEKALRDGTASYFPYTFRFSTYCMRFPYSEELFSKSPDLAYAGGGTLLGVYAYAGGGQRPPVGATRQRVPLVRLDRTYRTAGPVACGDGDFVPMRDAVLSDHFWRQGVSEPAPAGPGPGAYPVRASWCHGRQFNAAFGDGSVRAVEDDGTVEANTVPPGGELPDDGRHYATYAERVWQHFDARR